MASPLGNVSAAILAGGLGTRLRAVVADRPKVLAPVAGKPYLAHLLAQLNRAGIRETTLLVGYAANQVREAFGLEFDGMKLNYSVEPEPLGTGGAFRFALQFLREETVLLLNGDSYCDVDLPALATVHRTHSGFATLTLAEVLARSVAFETAYDPNECVELRWGAPPGREEASTCRAHAPADQRARMESYRPWFHERRRPPRK